MTSEKKLKFNIDNLQIPGKTFLFGEYAILAGGSCLGIGTKPCFTFDSSESFQVHPDSPAGRFIHTQNLNQKLISDKINFHNPYKVGGFGASTAEFLYYYLQSDLPQDLQTCFKTYRELYFLSNEQPSGMDVVTQLMGGLSLIEKTNEKIHHQYLNWNFSETEFVICSTGLKVQTHQHLAELDRKLCEQLVRPSQELFQLVTGSDAKLFFEHLNQWMQRLIKLQLMHPEIQKLKTFLDVHFQNKLSFFESKPCGALGADVVILFYKDTEKDKFSQLFEAIPQNRLKIQADLSQICDGPFASLDDRLNF